MLCRRPGDPTPTAGKRYPASVVEGRVAPRFILNPHPTPGLVIYPMSVVIGSPACGHVAGEPDSAVVGAGQPIAIFIQFSRTGNLRADITIGIGVENLLVALLAPVVQIIRTAGLKPLRINGVRAAQLKRLPVSQVLPIAVRAGDINIVGKVGKYCGVVVRYYIHAKLATLVEACAAARCAHVEALALPQTNTTDVNRPLGHAERDAVGGAVYQAYIGVRADAQISLPHLDLCAPVGVGEDAIARAQREIWECPAPVVRTCGLDRNRAGDGGESPRLGWRVVILGKRNRRCKCE